MAELATESVEDAEVTITLDDVASVTDAPVDEATTVLELARLVVLELVVSTSLDRALDRLSSMSDSERLRL